MANTIAAVMRHCNNFHEAGCAEVREYEIDGDGVLSPAVYAPYIAITGSMYNDGVYKANSIPAGRAETFTGRVWALNPSPLFIDLCRRIKDFNDKAPQGLPQQETFGGYSYTRAATMQTWQGVFAQELRPYKRMFSEVRL